MNEEQRRELVVYRLDKAKETLAEVESHIKSEFWNTAVNRLYYACFYAVTALLAEHEMYSKTYSSTRQMFALHFVKSGLVTKEAGKFYSVIFDLRHSGDYEDFSDFSGEQVMELLEPAPDLIASIEEILRAE